MKNELAHKPKSKPERCDDVICRRCGKSGKPVKLMTAPMGEYLPQFVPRGWGMVRVSEDAMAPHCGPCILPASDDYQFGGRRG